MPPGKKEQTRGRRYALRSWTKHPKSIVLLPSSSSTCRAGTLSHNSSLEIGVGAGTLYMLVSCQQELQRLNKAVQQTEAVVQKMQEQLQHHKGNLRSPSLIERENIDVAVYKTVWNHVSQNSHDRKMQPAYSRSGRSGDAKHDRDFTRQSDITEQSSQMDALEAELEAELELMQLNMSSEGSCSSQAMLPASDEADSKRIAHDLKGDLNSHGKLTASDESTTRGQSAHLEPVRVDYAVSAIELDRRLREVLEAQQKERIMELEILLKRTEEKLLVKEQEVISWKNRVEKLTRDIRLAPDCDGHTVQMDNCNAASSTLPEVTVKSFQDFPSQTSRMEKIDQLPKTRAFPRSSSPSTEREGLMELVKVVTESQANWHLQERLIGTPDTGEIDVQMPLVMKLRGACVSRLSEASECSFEEDDRSNDMLSSCQTSSEHPESSSGNPELVPRSNACLTPCFTHHSQKVPASHSFDVPSIKENRTAVETLMTCSSCLRPDATGSDCSDANWSESKSCHARRHSQAAPRRSLQFKGESLQIVTKGLRRSLTTLDKPTERQSPVLDKIRHWEALGRDMYRGPSLDQGGKH